MSTRIPLAIPKLWTDRVVYEACNNVLVITKVEQGYYTCRLWRKGEEGVGELQAISLNQNLKTTRKAIFKFKETGRL